MAKALNRVRRRVCKNCEQPFAYKIGAGRDRLFCSKTCATKWNMAKRSPRSAWPLCKTVGCERLVRSYHSKTCSRCNSMARAIAAGVCTVHKCTKPATRSGGALCEMHYCRKRRTGSLSIREKVGVVVTHEGYVKRWAPDHPMSDKMGYAFEHRMVLFDACRGVCPECFWCGQSLEWALLVVDHLNEIKDDNRVENLAPACNRCNRARGAMIPFIRGLSDGSLCALIDTFGFMRREKE